MAKRRRLNREKVVEKAAAMANEAGSVTAVSLTALAEALEIRPPSLYNHISSQEDLYYGMTLFGLQQLITDLRQVSLGLIGRDALMAMASAYRHFVHTHPGVYPLTICAPTSEQTELLRLSQEMIQMLLLVMASLGLQGDDAIHGIRGLRAILHGFASLEAAEGYKMALDQEESFRRLVSAYLDGLRQ
jgi:AcrR family transcriptional regulator